MLPESPDRVVFLPAADLFAGAVALRVTHGVAAEAVGGDLQEERALAAPLLQRGLGRLANSEHIHPVGPRAGHAVALGLLAHLTYGRSTLNGRSHPVLVVLAYPQDGEFPHGRQIERFVEVSDIGGAVAEQADGGSFVPLIAVRQRQAGRPRPMCTGDRGAA